MLKHFNLILVCLLVSVINETHILEIEKGTKIMSLVVKKGDDFQIRLRGHPSTGYIWTLLNKEELENLNNIKNIESQIGKNVPEIIFDNHEVGDVGYGGNFVFSFKALNPSNDIQELKFAYLRPWVKTKNNTIDVVVNILITEE